MCENLEDEGYTIHTIIDELNDTIGVLYNNFINYGFEDTVFTFKVVAEKNITSDNNLNVYCESLQYWGCINE